MEKYVDRNGSELNIWNKNALIIMEVIKTFRSYLNYNWINKNILIIKGVNQKFRIEMS